MSSYVELYPLGKRTSLTVESSRTGYEKRMVELPYAAYAMPCAKRCHTGTVQDRTGQDRTGQDRTGQDRTGQDRTGQDRTGRYWRYDKCKALTVRSWLYSASRGESLVFGHTLLFGSHLADFFLQ